MATIPTVNNIPMKQFCKARRDTTGLLERTSREIKAREAARSQPRITAPPPPMPAPGLKRYRTVDSATVPAEKRHHAECVARICLVKLGLPRLHINWVRQATVEDAMLIQAMKDYGGHPSFRTYDWPPRVWAWVDLKGAPDTVFLRTDTDLSTLTHAVAHETHHLWAHMKYGLTAKGTDRAEYEEAADRFYRICVAPIFEE